MDTDNQEAAAKEPETFILKIELGATLNSPVWCSHQRGKNWWAAIERNPDGPGGLGRRFASKARGAYYYKVPEWLAIGVPVEFGADYYTCAGRRDAHRWYGVVTRVTEEEITVTRCAGPRLAIRAAEPIRAAREAAEKRRLKRAETKARKQAEEAHRNQKPIDSVAAMLASED